ncbi:MAG: hypothetical protein ACREUF_01175 [Solimonas sp.]
MHASVAASTLGKMRIRPLGRTISIHAGAGGVGAGGHGFATRIDPPPGAAHRDWGARSARRHQSSCAG